MLAVRALVVRLMLTGTSVLATAPSANASANVQIPQVDRASSGDVTAALWLDRTQVEEYEQVRLNLRITNPHPTEERTIGQVDLRLPGLVPAGSCWDEATPTCSSSIEAGGDGSWTIPAQGTVLLWGDVRRRSAMRGAHVLSGTFQWSAPDNVLRPALVAPVSVEFLGPRPFGLAREWLDFLKDMVLPLTLIALAWVLQRVQQSRSEQQVVWAKMLEKVHQNAEKYYLPATMAMDTLGVRLRALGPLSTRHANDFEASLLQLLVLFKRMRLMVRKIGGFYFKDRCGERAVARSWEVFYRGARAHIDVETLDRLVDSIDAFESESQFAVRKVEPTFLADCQTVQAGLAAWAKSTLPVCLHALSLGARLFDVETNRPFELWYGDKEAIPYEQIGEMRRLLDGVQNTGTTIDPQERDAFLRLNIALDRYVQRNPLT